MVAFVQQPVGVFVVCLPSSIKECQYHTTNNSCHMSCRYDNYGELCPTRLQVFYNLGICLLRWGAGGAWAFSIGSFPIPG